MLDRLTRNWVYGGVMAGLLLLGLLPAISGGWSLALVAVYLQLPVYMLHQFEEHDDDRFHRFVDNALAGGRDVLPSAAIWVINIPGVWGVNLVSFALATQSIGWGLIGIYLTLVNAVAHIAQGFALRRYNPGLVTAVVLFLPVGGVAAWLVNAAGVSLLQQVVAIVLAIGIHAAIILYVRFNLRHPGAPLVMP